MLWLRRGAAGSAGELLLLHASIHMTFRFQGICDDLLMWDERGMPITFKTRANCVAPQNLTPCNTAVCCLALEFSLLGRSDR